MWASFFGETQTARLAVALLTRLGTPTVFAVFVATTSAALAAGAHIIVIGTTTATSTSGNSVDASMVIIFTKMFGFFKHWMHVRS